MLATESSPTGWKTENSEGFDLSRSHTSRQLSDGLFLLTAVTVAVVRFLILRDGGAPATIDAGNWLAFGDALFGVEVRSPTIVYPPLVPLLTKGFAETLGLINGVAALGALASLAPATGFYVALRRYGASILALPGAVILLGASAVGEATAWGGFPQLIGLGLTPLILFEVDRWLSSGARSSAICTGVLLMALFATTHFIGFVVAVASVVIVALGIPRARDQGRSWYLWLVDAILILLPSIWLAPLYLDLATAFSGSSGDFRFLNQLTWFNLPERIEFLYRDFPNLWRVALPLAVITPLLFWRRRDSALWRVLTALVLSSAGLAFITREGRFLYFSTLIVALAMTLWLLTAKKAIDRRATLSRPIPRRGWQLTLVALLTVALGLAAWQAVAGAGFFREQREYYGVLTPGLYRSLQDIHDETPDDTVVAVTSLRNAPLGWWVEAITRRPTYYGSALRWLSFEDEHERARVGNEIFSRSFPDEQSFIIAQEHDISYLIVPTRWGQFDVDVLGPESDTWASAWFTAKDVVVIPVAEFPTR